MKRKLFYTLFALVCAAALTSGCSVKNDGGAEVSNNAETISDTDNVESISDADNVESIDNGAQSVDNAESIDNVEVSEGDDVELTELQGMDEIGLTVDLGPLLDDIVPLADGPASSVLTPTAPGTSVFQNTSAVIDYSNASDGYICVAWNGGGSPKLKTTVKGPGGTSYTYDLRTDGKYEVFPLSDGNGSYTVAVCKNVSGTKYSVALSGTVSAQLKDEFAPFLRSNQYVSFTADSASVKKAAEVCKDAADNLAKVEKVYTFVVGNLTYDQEKAKTVKTGYIPDVDAILSAKKGICFDYASLMAAMLRSQGVPVKLVIGYTGQQYHAWINVWSEKDGWVNGKIYFDGKEWKLMDPTFASSANQSESIMKYIGNGSNYTAKYLY